MSTTIREVNSNELDTLLKLYKHLHSNDIDADNKDLKNIFARIITNPNSIILGLYSDDELVASCHLSIIENLTRGCRSYALIENVVTHAKYRRKGYSTDILKHAISIAKQQNCYKVMLFTGQTSQAIYDLYTKAGFSNKDKNAYSINLI